MLGLTLFYVGAVLLINGIWLKGGISDREVTVINIFVGFLSVFVAVVLIVGADASDSGQVNAGAMTLLFAFTYLWVAANQFLEVDGRGLGWFCLFVSVTASVVAAKSAVGAGTLFETWNAINWASWAVLWFSFYLLLTRKKPIASQVGNLSIACAIGTGWVPGFLLLQGIVST